MVDGRLSLAESFRAARDIGYPAKSRSFASLRMTKLTRLPRLNRATLSAGQRLRTTNDQRLPTAHRIHKQPHRPRHARWQLPEERIPSVDIYPLAVMRDQQPALLLVFAWIMRFEQRCEIAVPLIHKIKTALLHPAVEVLLRDLIWVMKDRVRWIENLDRRLFDRNAGPAKCCRIRRIFARIKIDRHPKRSHRVVLHDQAPTIFDELEQPGVVINYAFLGIISADAQHDRLVLAQVLAGQLVSRNHRDIHPDLLEHRRNVVARAPDVSNFEVSGDLHIHDRHALHGRLVVIKGAEIFARDHCISLAVGLFPAREFRSNMSLA